MRRLLTILAAAGVACAAVAETDIWPASITTGTNGAASISSKMRGEIVAVYAGVADGYSTGTVAVSYAPEAGGTVVNVATGAVTDEKVWRPVVDSTAVDGTALTNDTPQRFALAGELVTIAVTGGLTNTVWTIAIVSDR